MGFSSIEPSNEETKIADERRRPLLRVPAQQIGSDATTLLRGADRRTSAPLKGVDGAALNANDLRCRKKQEMIGRGRPD